MSFLIKRFLPLLLTGALCLACYMLGRSHAEVKIIKEKGEEIIKEVEVIKYVNAQKSQIYSKPHINREHALELFKRGIL